jgi:hypothetical protein
MGTEERYRIIDEPRPGAFARFAVNPVWAFLALMILPLAGAVLFIVNILALRGPHRWAEGLLLAGSLGLRGFGAPLLADLYDALGWSSASFRYATVVPIGASLYLGYRVYLLQAVSFELRSYFDALRQS